MTLPRTAALATVALTALAVACGDDATTSPAVAADDAGTNIDANVNSDGGAKPTDDAAVRVDSGTADAKTDAAPSPDALPIGDLPGWRQILAEDFSTAAADGNSFASTYALSWCPYTDNTKYKRANVTASGGNMVFTLDGTTGAAGVWAVGGCTNAYVGTTYNRYSIRFKAVGASGNGTAMMVWPVSDIWGDGEIDYPEGNFQSTFFVNHHGVGCGNACGAADSTDTGKDFQSWHIATTEWTSTSVVYYVDGAIVKTITHDIPSTPHRYTIQMAPTGTTVETGQFLVDWVTIYQKI